ncbi:TetR family transcriptional regulator [Kitasatospora sp. NBC_00315]|uniref:TetR family transcriptional regulator n=1 Tax=Kitasatospora sp. NBC_00315 TaxID=2975963 RepID=UPI00324C0FD0
MRADTDRQEPAGRSGTRRRPVQQRSQERYERIVDACAALLDEAGATALTTKAVAQRARVPIGTLYQFFSGKESLLAALAARNLERYLDRLARRLAERPAGGTAPTVAGFVELAVEEFVAMKRALPGFGQVDFGLVVPTPAGVRDDLHLLDTALDNNTAVALRLQELGGGLFAAGPACGPDGGPDLGGRPDGGPDPGGRPGVALTLRVALEAADAVLKLAFRTDPDGDPVLIAECKRLLVRYLAAPPGSD